MRLPRIGISLGDPAGIGPEVALRSVLASGNLPPARYLLYAAEAVVREEARALDLALPETVFRSSGEPEGAGVFLVPLTGGERAFPKGRATPGSGRASFAWFEAAVEAACRGEIDAVVTAPISKLAWARAGLPWRGHTEYLQSRFPGAIMSFWSDRLSVVLLSHHLPLREAIERVTANGLGTFLRAVWAGIAGNVSREAEILVAGLNPHAGEDGLLGTEERDILCPAIEDAQRSGIPVRGPFPPDVVFRMALGRPERVVAALYHDQGLIPFKLAAFETGVNATLGLPFIRMSPDHGTAYDIAGKRTADPASMTAAIRRAAGSAARGF